MAFALASGLSGRIQGGASWQIRVAQSAIFAMSASVSKISVRFVPS